jgi:hypothetical protein
VLKDLCGAEGGVRRGEEDGTDMWVEVSLGGVLQNQIVSIAISEGRNEPGDPRVGEFLRSTRRERGEREGGGERREWVEGGDGGTEHAALRSRGKRCPNSFSPSWSSSLRTKSAEVGE